MPSVIVAKRRESVEILNLVRSLGYRISSVIEFREAKNPKYFLSIGKIGELKSVLSGEKVIIDGILKSSQWYNLERELGVEVRDRVGLIIDIFADRAKSREAMMQVEYAQLKYEIPRIRELIHHQRAGEHAGWMGAGEYEIADYYEMIRRRMSRIEKELKKMKIIRAERRKRRRKEGFVLVGIGGYTNSGKSTLMNALTSSGRVMESRMFSTLATKTSRMGKSRILITDTVGFVEDMPPWLIHAFEPTLEEIYEADVVILLADGSDSIPEFQRKVSVSANILESHVNGTIVPVINKVDVADNIDEKLNIMSKYGPVETISAKEGVGIDSLISRIEKEAGVISTEVKVKTMNSELCAYIRRYGQITKIEEDDCITIHFKMRRELLENLQKIGSSCP